MNVPIEPRLIDQELALTKPRLKALEAFADGESGSPGKAAATANAPRGAARAAAEG